ncbi:MAG: bifunctional oligoribonuclease/PAP phosphatase NrnA [Flavobacteriales bacterium]|nr:bifunctional oligoribonuclease/PAP phosphatase NrnA [Flavobacteriales bacterium]MCB0811901.1 bifunctional oligoribonuclease/PAP phosphatase NrnA [Flavobacteriales bacterium]MCB9199354.1 bifunctional oligoribonuclease/PAP phosphatase NrnA [Flavobacteriales bacterium]HOP43175.1 bifunctional oligoribonuclease/PAP phosphatase NrnA [Flavobacteriales bacterium]HPF67467.1 bifunctional oligoribonuclease/PAP phosphatase NrnA [Flavobacteriales bacterium]
MSAGPAHSLPADQVEALRDLLARPRRIAIVTHHNPDGDAMGSGLGWCRLLRAAGHDAVLVLPNTPAHFLHWMPGFDEVLAVDQDRQRALSNVRDREVLFCLDFNRLDRIGELQEAAESAPIRVLVDHHRDPADVFQVVFSEVTACSTCQLVYDIAIALGWEQLIDEGTATCLYTGIMTDSGSFRFSSTTAHTHRVAASLLEKGVRPDRVHEDVMDDNPEHRLRLLGFTLSERLSVHEHLATAVIQLSAEDLARHDFHPGDTEGFVNYGLSIRGVRLAAFFMQRGDEVKISLRSRGELPVNEFLGAHFHGGGHRNAAGGRSTLGLDATVARFLELLPPFLEAHP